MAREPRDISSRQSTTTESLSLPFSRPQRFDPHSKGFGLQVSKGPSARTSQSSDLPRSLQDSLEEQTQNLGYSCHASTGLER